MNWFKLVFWERRERRFYITAISYHCKVRGEIKQRKHSFPDSLTHQSISEAIYPNAKAPVLILK